MLNQDDIFLIERAVAVLEASFQREDLTVMQPGYAKTFCQLKLGALEHEVFSVLFLDTQNRLIKFEHVFRGTINSCTVYPREVVKLALELNAAACIFTHNHPSGEVYPSDADKQITVHLVKALELFDIRVLDHIIVSKTGTMSFSERGLL